MQSTLERLTLKNIIEGDLLPDDYKKINEVRDNLFTGYAYGMYRDPILTPVYVNRSTKICFVLGEFISPNIKGLFKIPCKFF